MKTPPMIRVRAVGDARVPRVAADGVPEASNTKGRFVARDRAKAALPDGELVPDTTYYRAEIAAGSLELAPEPTPAQGEE
jgi:hypothetical protein